MKFRSGDRFWILHVLAYCTSLQLITERERSRSFDPDQKSFSRATKSISPGYQGSASGSADSLLLLSKAISPSASAVGHVPRELLVAGADLTVPAALEVR